MFIGEVEETGVIEPLVFPRVVAADEPMTPQTEGVRNPVATSSFAALSRISAASRSATLTVSLSE